MKNKVTLGLIQMTCQEDIKANFDKTVLNIKEAANQGAQIICTQELFKSPYFCQVEDPDFWSGLHGTRYKGRLAGGAPVLYGEM